MISHLLLSTILCNPFLLSICRTCDLLPVDEYGKDDGISLTKLLFMTLTTHIYILLYGSILEDCSERLPLVGFVEESFYVVAVYIEGYLVENFGVPLRSCWSWLYNLTDQNSDNNHVSLEEDSKF